MSKKECKNLISHFCSGRQKKYIKNVLSYQNGIFTQTSGFEITHTQKRFIIRSLIFRKISLSKHFLFHLSRLTLIGNYRCFSVTFGCPSM